MIFPLFEGMAFGLLFIFSFGPGFFAYLNISINKGIRSAIFFIVGISLSDIIMISGILLGFSNLLENETVRLTLGIMGIVMLTGYGVYLILNPGNIKTKAVYTPNKSSNWQWLLKGSMINGLNPNILIFWIGVISTISARYENVFQDQVFFMIGVLAIILSADITKASLALKLKNYLTYKMIRAMNVIVGVIMIGFGISIGVYVYTMML